MHHARDFASLLQEGYCLFDQSVGSGSLMSNSSIRSEMHERPTGGQVVCFVNSEYPPVKKNKYELLISESKRFQLQAEPNIPKK